MKHILALSTVIVAIGTLSGSSRHVPGSPSAVGQTAAAPRGTAPETRSFVYSSGRDGSGGETFTRDGDMISGDMVIGANHVHYEGRAAADGTIPRLDMRAWRSAAEAKNPRVLSAIVGRDGEMLIEHLKSHVDTLRFPSQPGIVTMINPSIGLAEVVVARARAQKSRSVKVPILFIDALRLDTPGKDKIGAEPVTLDVTFLAADTVMIGNGNSTDQMRLIIGADGRCRGASNGATSKEKFSMRPTTKRVSSSE